MHSAITNLQLKSLVIQGTHFFKTLVSEAEIFIIQGLVLVLFVIMFVLCIFEVMTEDGGL